MQIGMIGLGRMGANMVRRLAGGGHECVAFDQSAAAVQALSAAGVHGAHSLAAFIAALAPPRVVWLMVPAAIVDKILGELAPLMHTDDVIIDGGNSYYHDDLRRGREMQRFGIHYVDVGTSGGVLGLEQGFCLMIGGEPAVVRRLEPIFATLAPGARAAAGAPAGTAARGYLHCGAVGAGHFVKMVHNGIEYGLMAAYAEGLNILKHADAGAASRSADAETAPLQNPQLFQYTFDIAAIAEVWRHGSIVASQLLDLTAAALARDPQLEHFAGRVADSGEGRWTIQAAIEEGVPAHVLSAALYSRFDSRGNAEYAGKVLSAMRLGFGGHVESKS
ncbi:MAG TPA: decarboxylating 6-phosphogluconate dehydrogenase [Steroidobacteraceae bacterium]|jgi:6-phosphogluconate dehydrogenase|nr:decarboxylating 6-phosphogluconate dehydrogenase [Steroidobacteraceae bacterium]